VSGSHSNLAVAAAPREQAPKRAPSSPHLRIVGMDWDSLKPTVEQNEPDGTDPNQVTISIGDDGAVGISDGADDQPQVDDNFDANLALRLDDMALANIAAMVIEGAEADVHSRQDWTETADKAVQYLGVRLVDPTSAVTADGTICKAVASSMLEANVKLWAVARAELLPVSGPVKVRRDDLDGPQNAGAQQPQPDGQPSEQQQQDELAEALESDMNHYLTVTDRGYYADFSRMLRSRAAIGNAFRKVYWDPLLRRPVSRWVKAQNFVFSNDCTVWEEAGRKTEIVPMRQSTMRRMMAAGHYRDIPLAHPTGQATPSDEAVAETEGITATPERPEDYEHTVYEQYVEIGSGTSSNLMGDMRMLERDEEGSTPGYPLPYRVSVDLDSREVLEIKRDWRKGDADHRSRRHYVRYGFIPGEGAMDWGLIHLIGNAVQGETMLMRSAVDGSMFANFPGGLMARGPGSRQSDTVLRQSPGEWKAVDVPAGQKVADLFTPNPYHEPGAAHMALQAKFSESAHAVAGLIDLPVGEGRIGNMPVGTIMSYIESVSMVPGAVHKDDHMTQQLEFEMLRELIAEDPSVLAHGKSPRAQRRSRQWTAEELLDPELVPAADPNTPSEIHRLMKGQMLVQGGGLPQFQGIADNRAIWAEVVQLVWGADPQQFTLPVPQAPPPPPDPRIVAAQIKAQQQQQSDQTKAQIAQQTADSRLTELAMENRNAELDRQSDEVRAAIGEDTARVKVTHDTANAAADRVAQHQQHLDDHGLAVQQAMQPPPFAAPLSGDGT
jgi:hypothetical protein